MKNVKTGKMKLHTKILIIIAAVLVLVIITAGVLFINEFTIMASIKKVIPDKPVYMMEVKGDYHFDEFIEAGGATSDDDVSRFLTNKISKGFYSVDVENLGTGCSNISALSPDGSHMWGRNFDWKGSVPIIVKHTPKNGYASISTCDFQNITSSAETVPEGLANKMIAIAALYVPLDGINEKGLCIADLEVNEGGMITLDTDKPNLTTTTALRLLLNEAATVDEAVALLKQYDIYASGGISHHFAIADATGKSVVIEFVDGEQVVIDSNYLTNFNLANGDPTAGGESSKQRYDTLVSVYEDNGGVFTGEQIKDLLSQVAKYEQEFSTQWSIVYDQNAPTATYYFNGDYGNAYPIDW